MWIKQHDLGVQWIQQLYASLNIWDPQFGNGSVDNNSTSQEYKHCPDIQFSHCHSREVSRSTLNASLSHQNPKWQSVVSDNIGLQLDKQLLKYKVCSKVIHPWRVSAIRGSQSANDKYKTERRKIEMWSSKGRPARGKSIIRQSDAPKQAWGHKEGWAGAGRRRLQRRESTMITWGAPRLHNLAEWKPDRQKVATSADSGCLIAEPETQPMLC